MSHMVDLIGNIKNADELKDFFQMRLVEILSYDGAICILADKINYQVMKIFNILNYSETRLGAILVDGNIRPELLTDGYVQDSNRLNYFSIIYGLNDSDRRYINYLEFYKEGEGYDPQSMNRHLLKIISPFLYNALIKLYHSELKNKLIGTITQREIEVLKWVSRGKTNWEIGIILNISGFTVKNHISNILFKLEVSNRAQALEKAMDVGYCLWDK